MRITMTPGQFIRLRAMVAGQEITTIGQAEVFLPLMRKLTLTPEEEKRANVQRAIANGQEVVTWSDLDDKGSQIFIERDFTGRQMEALKWAARNLPKGLILADQIETAYNPILKILGLPGVGEGDEEQD